MNGKSVGVSLVPGTKKRVVVRLRYNVQYMVDGVCGGRRLPRQHRGRPIELVEIAVTRAEACSSGTSKVERAKARPSSGEMAVARASDVERAATLRHEPAGVELIVLLILTGHSSSARGKKEELLSDRCGDGFSVTSSASTRWAILRHIVGGRV